MATICKIGETKEIKGKLFRKEASTNNYCHGCYFYERPCPGNSVSGSIEEGGSECKGSIWKPVRSPVKKDITANVPKGKVKATWERKLGPEITIRTTKRQIIEHLDAAITALNVLGFENAKLKNQITKLKQSGAK